MLIYKTYNSADENTEYVEFRINNYENATIKLYEKKSEIQPIQDNTYKIEKGAQIKFECKVKDGYGIYSLALDNEKVNIDNIQKIERTITMNNTIQCDIELKKVFEVEVQNTGKGNTTLKNEVQGNKSYVFESDQLQMNCVANKYNYISKICINGEVCLEYKENEEYIHEYVYISPEIDHDYSIIVEYETEKYSIDINENEDVEVRINGVKTNNLSVNGGEDITIEIESKGDDLFINSILVNSVGKKLTNVNSKFETIAVSKIACNYDIDIETEIIEKIYDAPETIFEIKDENGEEFKHTIVEADKKYMYCFSSKKDILVSFKKRFILMRNDGVNKVNDTKVLITKNTYWKECCFFVTSKNSVRYAYPIYFIFDTTPPQTPTYTLSHESLTKTTLTTTIKDSGESGVDSVQFGTKSDYEANLSSEETKKKYGYKLENTTETTYTIAFDQADLSEENYYIWATDNATNRSEMTKLDLEGPEVTITSKADWSNQDIVIEGNAKDKESSISTISYSTNKEVAKADYSGKKNDKVSTATPNENGEFTIECKSEKSGIITYYIWAYDSYGNKSEKIVTYEAKIDKKAPVLTLVKKHPTDKWTNTVITMEFTATDKEEQGYSGIEKIYYAMDQETSKVTNLEVNEDEKQSYVIQTPKGEDGKAIAMQGYYFIYAVDQAGNQSKPLKVELNIDVDAPKPCSLELTTKNGAEVTIKKYGTFANQEVRLDVSAQESYVTAEDRQTIASGTKEIALLCDGAQIAKAKAKEDAKQQEGICSFELKPGIDGELSVVTYDNAGNQSEPIKISTVNPSYHSYVCLETESPEIQIACAKPDYKDEAMAAWFASHQELMITVKDKAAGLQKIEAVLNGTKLVKQSDGKELVTIDKAKKTTDTVFLINSVQSGASEEGKYVLELTAYDNAGNQKTYSKTIYVDDQEPVITKFAFEANGIQDHKDKLVEKLDYGYFFNGSTKVTVSAEDQTPSAGIKEIEYYLVDYGKNKDGVESKKKVIKTDSEGNASFIIDKDFKGKICARAFDSVHNTTASYAKPYGIVIDSSTKETKNSQISFTTPDTGKKDKDGTNLYNKDVDVTVDLANYFKGIRTVEWEVNEEGEDGKGKSGKIEVSTSGQLSGDRTGYQILETDKNLITHLQGKIRVSGNSNKIRLHVVLTDRSGVASEQELYLSIDKSKPQVAIAFDKEHESTYYNEDRTATITVKDKNFSPDDVKFLLQNTHGDVPKLSSWSRQKDGETYVATLAFSRDGLYSLNVTATDLVGNTSDTVAAKTFTLDKTKPTVEVKLNQMQEKTGDIRYYNQAVQARISISEYNFDIHKVEVTGVAKNKGKVIAYPKLSYIHSTKQDHNMVIEFEQEGEYTLKVKCTDNAGNVAESEVEYHFIVDKSVPAIAISGVEDSKAYNGTVIPEVIVTDNNYKSQDTKIYLSNGKGEAVKVHPKMKKVADGYQFTLDCFPKEKEYDEVYTLSIQSKDMAGNESKKQMYFSVNRFGSSYQFSDSLQKASGKYSNKEFDIVLTETNVNAVDPSKSLVRMICNDTVKDLAENQDYTVESSGGDGKWYTYQYRISKDLLKEDGVYQFALYTKDEAGNINDNSEEEKQALVWFGIDRTAPRVVPINISDGGTYNQTKRQVYINVDDNIRMESGTVYVNEEEAEYTEEGNQYVVEMGSSNQAQNIQVVATDLAGNKTDVKVSNIYITTNVFVRMLHNRTVLMVGTIAVGVAFTAMLVVFVAYRRKQKKVVE